MNLPLRPWLPGSRAQPQAHTESGGPWMSTVQGEREEKKGEKDSTAAEGLEDTEL